jgi:hypothetical protein
VGVAEGDLVEASVQRGKIVLTPKTNTPRPQVLAADREYTPAQRRIIDRELAKGLDDIKAGRVYGPFTAGQATRFIKSELKTRAKKPK